VSQREYLLVGEQRIYEWDKCPKIEYTCDTCNEPIENDVAQVHLHIRRGSIQYEDRKTGEIEWFGIDLHLSCISSPGQWLADIIEKKTYPGRRSHRDSHMH
jgi:hypothetical protein